MIPFNEIDSRLEALGKNRAWLVDVTGRAEGSIRAALAPNAAPKQRTELLQRALSDAIEREEASRGPAAVQVTGVYEIRQTPEQSRRADLASRAVNSPSLEDFCLRAIIHRAEEILSRGIDPCASTFPEQDEPGNIIELPFLGAVAAGEPVSAPIDDTIAVPHDFPENHFVVEINGCSMEPDFPDGSRWVIDGRDKFTPKNGAACVVSDGSGSYLKLWDKRRKLFVSINPEFSDVIPAAEAKLQGYPVEQLV